MTYLAILASGIYLYMLIHTYKCNKDIECLSDIAYDKHSYLFPACVIAISVCLFIGMFIISPFPINWLSLIPILSLVTVSLVPYRDSLIKYKIHYIAAIIALISTFVIWALKGFWFIPILFCIASLRNKWLLGLEMGLFGSAFLYILI